MTGREQLRSIYQEAHTIAVVGCSDDERKPANIVPRYLLAQGYHIVPVNPRRDALLGERCAASLSDISIPVDIVLVFRPAEDVPPIARDAARIGARCLWLQQGISSYEAAVIGERAGLKVVMDRCMGVEHGLVGLGPGVDAWLAEGRSASRPAAAQN